MSDRYRIRGSGKRPSKGGVGEGVLGVLEGGVGGGLEVVVIVGVISKESRDNKERKE